MLFARIPLRARRLPPRLAAAALPVALLLPWLSAAQVADGAATTRAAVVAGTAAPAGSYTLIRAGGAAPPVDFAMETPAGSVAGTIDAARVDLAADGSYASDVTVSWTNPPAIPFLPSGKGQHVLHGTGHYAARGDDIVLEPDDFLSRRLARVLTAHTEGTRIRLTRAEGGMAGERRDLNALFERVK